MAPETLHGVFAASMARLGPFEPAPQLAVAVSGGADSMALAVLADRWVRRRRGTVVALVVDHGLRPHSAAEATATRARLAGLGIASRLLVWRGDKPATGIQAAARAARYRLLENWCARHGVLHLMTGHQREDQAETLLIREARGSGPDGLAAMPAVAERAWGRLLRPLLDVPRETLAAFLRCQQIGWLDDPSNADPAFARVRARAALTASGSTALHAATARRMGATRAALERDCARLLGRYAAVFPQGYVRIARSALTGAPPVLGRRALARLLACVGGSVYPPRGQRLDGLLAAIAAPSFTGRTLAGCRVLPEGPSLLIVREVRDGAAMAIAASAAGLMWDGRFQVASAGARPGRIEVLGEAGWAELLRRRPDLRGGGPPFAARLALPALRDRRGVVIVPHLGFGRFSRKAGGRPRLTLVFRPARPLCPAEFPVA